MSILKIVAVRNSSKYLQKTGKTLGGNSQNFLCKFIRFFVSLGLKILTLFRLKALLKQISLKGDVHYCTFYTVKAPLSDKKTYEFA